MATLAMVTLGLLVWVCTAFVVSTRKKMEAMYFAGQVSGLRQAAAIAREHGDDSLRCAPAGQLSTGVIRAQVAHELELQIRSDINRVGKP